MIVLGVVAVAMLAISFWGFWAMPNLLSHERDERIRRQRENQLRRGVVAFFLAGVVSIGLLVHAMLTR
jgi:hypothetical protein